MEVKDAIYKLRFLLHDVSGEHADDKCIILLNTASHQTALLLIDMGSALMLHDTTIKDGNPLPAYFVRTAGTYPIRITGTTINFLDDDVEEMAMRYFATVPPIKTYYDTMPFENDVLNDWVVRLASLLAANRNEFDISQDKALMAEFQQAAQTAMMGVA